MLALNVQYYLSGPACLPVCCFARPSDSLPLVQCSCVCSFGRNVIWTLPPSEASESCQRRHPCRLLVAARTHAHASKQAKKASSSVHAANDCILPPRSLDLEPSTLDRGSTTPKTAVAQHLTSRRRSRHSHGLSSVLTRRRPRRRIRRPLHPHLSLPQAVRRPLVRRVVATMAAQDAEQR